MNWSKAITIVAVLAIIVLVYDATYGFKALMPGASGPKDPTA